ncbi:MAG TPA: TetR/AcrR family transcriptional regulator [Longimicrobium sp.]|jgi:AcrR family transcriptional regulator|uniref:TetR/AcrR family transcriptional regulator n=1 Tax=Longimicrobium sp. TaxID=2029185 RepID=UPI002EDB2E14
MGTKERRERERAETRARILDAAREMFATQGVGAVTMRAIAERIEYTPTAIYHHFKDKDALIIELCHADFRLLGVELGRSVRIADPVERLRRIGTAYVQFAITHPHHYHVMFMTATPAHDHDDVSIQKNNPEEDAYGLLVQTVAEGIAAGRFRPEFTDAHELAQIHWSGIHGVISLHMAKKSDAWIDWRDMATTAARMIDVLVRGTTLPEEA